MSEERAPPGRHLAAFALLLLMESPDHGRHLHQRMNAILPKPLQVDTGNLYRALRELESRGMVRSLWDTKDCGPAKRIYAVTPAAKTEIKLWRADIASRREAFDWFLKHSEPFVEEGAEDQSMIF